MQHLKILFSFLLLGLFVVGCQTDSNDPGGNSLLKPGNPLIWEDPAAIPDDDGYWVDLVAGQHDVVGKVWVTEEDGDLTVTYELTDLDCEITVIHLDLASELSNDFPTGGFHANNKGNPQIGLFDFTEGDFVNNSITIPEADVLAALGVSSPFSGKIYIGAHAEVCCPGTGSGTEALCPDFLPDEMTPIWDPPGPGYYTVEVTFTEQGGPYYGWCVDGSRHINNGVPRFVDFICSYSPDMPTCTTFLEHPENLDLVNWIINNIQLDWDRRTIQAAIWELINPSATLIQWTDPNAPNYYHHNATLREEIVVLALANGEGFIPSCNEKVLIIAWSSATGNICEPNMQIVAFEVPVECEQECETAWGFKFPIDDTSELFPGHVWFRYFGYDYPTPTAP